jgi:hypothetical protein
LAKCSGVTPPKMKLPRSMKNSEKITKSFSLALLNLEGEIPFKGVGL